MVFSLCLPATPRIELRVPRNSRGKLEGAAQHFGGGAAQPACGASRGRASATQRPDHAHQIFQEASQGDCTNCSRCHAYGDRHHACRSDPFSHCSSAACRKKRGTAQTPDYRRLQLSAKHQLIQPAVAYGVADKVNSAGRRIFLSNAAYRGSRARPFSNGSTFI